MQFLLSQATHGQLFDHIHQGNRHITSVVKNAVFHPHNCSGYVYKGKCILQKGEAYLSLSEGMYFSVDQGWSACVDGEVFVVQSERTNFMPSFGGPVEHIGRLRYIDGCTDSLLLHPARLGDPCLNLLVFPQGIHQSSHTHPSFRVGLVISGSGFCVIESGDVPLQPGDKFYIPQNFNHCFKSGPEGLRVISYHPDSDFGATDQVHPMINGTHLS